jgi:hypothetical protein
MKRANVSDNGSWSFAEELLERGDPQFVREVRRLTDAERLGNFAPRWYADRRPAARQLLFTYLDQPLNAFRHEALVKRLFKLAEAAGDDEVMARFLVLFDRSVRRVIRKGCRRFESRTVDTLEEAQALEAQWRAQGSTVSRYADQSRILSLSGKRFTRYIVHRYWTEDTMGMPSNTEMWRPYRPRRLKDVPFGAPAQQLRGRPPTGPHPVEEAFRTKLEKQRLFSVATRRYLRRRAWRYFRKLGKSHPERYVAAVSLALKLYRDADVVDAVALLDNWGLMHILFHNSPVLLSRPTGWSLAKGRTLAELEPAPACEPLWKATPVALVDLVREGKCRPVRQWAIRLIRREHEAILRDLSQEELFRWLSHHDPEVVSLAAELLRGIPDLTSLGVDRLLGLLDEPSPETVEILCDLLRDRLDAGRVTLAQAARLAGSRPLPAARLGFTWLRQKAPADAEECRALLGLVEAQAEPLRPEIVRWVRGVLSASPEFQADWVLEFLDSRNADVREEGWRWLQTERRAGDDVTLWQKLLESPYDDLRLKLIEVLEERVAGQPAGKAESGRFDPELVRFLWATVLLNIHRGGKTKPVVVSQLVKRLGQHPGEAEALLPILAVALRSVRGPEWRAGLTGLVLAVERNADLRPLVARKFPELTLES